MAASNLSDIMIEIGYATVKLLVGNMMIFKSTLKDELAERMAASDNVEHTELLNDAIEFLDKNT